MNAIWILKPNIDMRRLNSVFSLIRRSYTDNSYECNLDFKTKYRHAEVELRILAYERKAIPIAHPKIYHAYI